MSDDQNDKSGGWFGNPLPIVMVVLLAGGLLVKNVPLESARPTDPERIQFVPTTQQDVEARLWQDPFAAVEKHKKSSEIAGTLPKNTLMMLFEPTSPNTSFASHRLENLKNQIQRLNEKSEDVTVVAVSVFGSPYAEEAEIRRRSRFAVISALGFHAYHPQFSDAIGYFRINPSNREPNHDKKTKPYDDDVPYEWFEKQDRDTDKKSYVLVLWLKDEKLTDKPLSTLRDLFSQLTPPQQPSKDSFNVKLIGPRGSAGLNALVDQLKQKPLSLLNDINDVEVYSPSATISNCDLLNQKGSQPKWDCFKDPPSLLGEKALSIVRTTGTDDVLAAALLWELWLRGVNRDLGYVDPWWDRIWPTLEKWFGQNPTESRRKCDDGLVLIGERDTIYGRTLLRYLTDGFSGRCGREKQVRTFSYLRGLDGVLADADKSSSKTPPKDDSSKAKDLREQLEDAPPEHAEGRNQLDYLRRLADEIDRLDDDKSFAENGVKAIGLVGSDLYDKLLILQALRSRFKSKIFFTTDLDARYLHVDQKDWTRNLVVASNFGLSLRPALQHSTLPFRDSYQTATYLATLMALEQYQPYDWTLGIEDRLRPGLQLPRQILESYLTATRFIPPMALPKDWTEKMKDWMRPQIFEIGRTEAVHLASPSIERLSQWIGSPYKDIADTAKDTKCTSDLAKCENIEPNWPSRSLSLDHLSEILIMLCLGIILVALANRHVNETVRAAFAAPSPNRDAAWTILYAVIGTVVVVFIIVVIVWTLMDNSLVQGIGEPFVWFEGVSVWPSLVVRFVGLVTMLSLWYAFLKMIQQKEKPDKDFKIALPKIRKLNRSKMSAWLNGPHLKLALFDEAGNAEASSVVTKESTEKKIFDITTLWQNYLLATSWREMAGWIFSSMLLVGGLGVAAYFVFGKASFPHRGQLVVTLHTILVLFNGPLLWLVIFWVGYETRACSRFIETLIGARSLWPPVLLDHEEASTGVPSAHLDDYLDFKLIVHATQRIHWLIYLPFVGILFLVLSRSNFFDTMDFPLALVFVTGLALTYALYSAVLLRKSAEAARARALKNYETRLLTQTRATDSQPPFMMASPVSAEQIKILMERIRGTREGAFAPFAQQPALQALLLPFGGYGSVQIIEYLFKL